MDKQINRREFIEIGSTATLGMALTDEARGQESAKSIRIGVVGTGNRGCSLLGTMQDIQGLEFPALCDINTGNLARAQDIAVKAGHPRPEGYSEGGQ